MAINGIVHIPVCSEESTSQYLRLSSVYGIYILLYVTMHGQALVLSVHVCTCV